MAKTIVHTDSPMAVKKQQGQPMMPAGAPPMAPPPKATQRNMMRQMIASQGVTKRGPPQRR